MRRIRVQVHKLVESGENSWETNPWKFLIERFPIEMEFAVWFAPEQAEKAAD